MQGSPKSRSAACRWPAGVLAFSLLAGCPTTNQGPPRHYEDPGAMIDVFEDPERDAWQKPDQVVAALPIAEQNLVIADIGAGSGYFTRRLAQQVPAGRVYAVDVDGEFEDYLLEHREGWGTPNIEPHLALYDDPVLPPQSIDLVFSANTYAFIRNRVLYFKRVRASLTPGGHLALIDFRPGATPPGSSAPEEQHRVSVDAAKRELADAGFDVVSEEKLLEHQWFLILRPSGAAANPPAAASGVK